MAKATRVTSRRQRPRRRVSRRRPRLLLQRHPIVYLIELVSLIVCAAVWAMWGLGQVARQCKGLEIVDMMLPFALAVVGLIAASTLALWLWAWLRRRLLRMASHLPALVALGLAGSGVWFGLHAGYQSVFSDFPSLIGGRQQAAKTTLAHQVYAAYRRYDPKHLQVMIERSKPYAAAIEKAAQQHGLDADVLMGVAAAESSFLPRDSVDGGHGLFQITAVPAPLLAQARRDLDVKQLSLNDSQHNAVIAAATLRDYLTQMHHDLYLGLLAYNIGPKNGGLQFIMQQYGATDFVTLQPYLQQLPRDYPIRVLSHALAFRIWRAQGQLLAYQDGDNAQRIQQLGIPGLSRDTVQPPQWLK